MMFGRKKAKHPYELVTKENFEVIKGIFEKAVAENTRPSIVAQAIVNSTGLEFNHALALVHQELLGALKR